MDDYSDHDAIALAALVAAREVGAADLLDAAIARAEAADAKLNFLAHRLYDRARAAAKQPLNGPFAGVPFLVKDLHVDIAGAPTGEGSGFWNGNLATRDSILVERLEAAGVVIFGKTTTPELGLTHSTESIAYGLTRNPWDTSRTAGGSSGGSAAAVASGVVPVAQASDGGGSIRTPAACCGVFGLKPSRGRVPAGPGRTESWMGLSTFGVISRSVRDSAAMLDAIAGPEPGARYAAPTPERPFLAETARDPGRLRVALAMAPASGVAVDPEVAAVVGAAGRMLESLGHHVEPAVLPVDAATLARAMVTTIAVCTAADIDARAAQIGRPPRDDELETMTRTFLGIGRAASGEALLAASEAFQTGAIAMATWMRDYDVVLSPTLAQPPIPLGIIGLSPADPDAWGNAVSAFQPFTGLYNQTGQPAMTLPLGMTAGGLPIGVMIAGPYGAEGMLFRLAAQIEAAAPWRDRRPKIA